MRLAFRKQGLGTGYLIALLTFSVWACARSVEEAPVAGSNITAAQIVSGIANHLSATQQAAALASLNKLTFSQIKASYLDEASRTSAAIDGYSLRMDPEQATELSATLDELSVSYADLGSFFAGRNMETPGLTAAGLHADLALVLARPGAKSLALGNNGDVDPDSPEAAECKRDQTAALVGGAGVLAAGVFTTPWAPFIGVPLIITGLTNSIGLGYVADRCWRPNSTWFGRRKAKATPTAAPVTAAASVAAS